MEGIREVVKSLDQVGGESVELSEGVERCCCGAGHGIADSDQEGH
jgi:hypothetical protein